MARTRWKSKYKPKYCDMIIEAMAEGKSLYQFAASIDVGADTLYDWARKHEEFSDALEIARAKSVAFWENLGINLMIGAPLDPVRKGKGDKHVWMFFMRNRFRSMGYGDDDVFDYEKNDGFDV